MNPGNVRALGCFARQSIERLASSQLMIDSTFGTDNSGSDVAQICSIEGHIMKGSNEHEGISLLLPL